MAVTSKISVLVHNPTVNQRFAPPLMTPLRYRTCPKCKDYLGVVVPEPPEPVTEVPIDVRCLRCGFKQLWRVILGNKPILSLVWFVSFILTFSIPAYPHGGGLDSYGCHHNRKHATYQCHQGMFTVIQVVFHYEDLLCHLGVLPAGSLGKAVVEQFIAKEVPGCNHAIFWGVSYFWNRVRRIILRGYLQKCCTLSFLSNAYNLGAN